MKPLVKCRLVYNQSAHLDQLYAGFVRLEDAGVIELLVDPQRSRPQNSRVPILHATINDRYKVIYDTLDGLNWIPGTIEENIVFFQTTFHADYYFKRSFTRQLAGVAPLGCKVFPLGLNYHLRPERSLVRPPTEDYLREIVRRNAFASRILRANNDNMGMPSKDYEQYPIPSQNGKILFLTRVWDPDDFDGDLIKADIERLNKVRISVIKTCRKEFGETFCGGLTDDDFTRSHAKSLIAPFSSTNKKSYLELVKSHAVCIATTGLHGSIGWKFAEYVAASRAILSEPLVYEVPGSFRKGQNYLEFTDDDELVAGIRCLLGNRSILMEMMKENYHYYNNYVKADNLILKTLLTVLENS